MGNAEAQRRYRERHPELVRQRSRDYMRRRRAENSPEYQQWAADYEARWGKDAINFARNHSIPVSWARDLLDSKPGGCQICGGTERVMYDHDHNTGLYRGWLCNDCNLGLSRFSDSPTRLLAAAEYLGG